jgi:hypothetical protein
LVRQIRGQLDSVTATCTDQELFALGETQRGVLAQIHTSTAFLLVLTPWAVQSPHLWIELGQALADRLHTAAALFGLSAEDLDATLDRARLLDTHVFDIDELGSYIDSIRERLSHPDRPTSGW